MLLDTEIDIEGT